MDKVNVYAIYDAQGEKYDVPFFAHSDLFAKRRFMLMAEGEDSMLSKFLSEFQLDKIAEFDIITGDMIQDKKTVIYGKQLNIKVSGDTEVVQIENK